MSENQSTMTTIESIKLNVFGMISSYYKEFTLSMIDPTVDIYRMYENEVEDETLENLLKTCKVHTELLNVSSLINSGEILGASSALSEIEKMIPSAESVLPSELYDLIIVSLFHLMIGSSHCGKGKTEMDIRRIVGVMHSD
jgi:hypothetical protein